MAVISTKSLYLFLTIASHVIALSSSSPSYFNSTIAENCRRNPSFPYCNGSNPNIDPGEIFKFSVVANYLCNISRNLNCPQSFAKIDLHGNPEIAPLYLSYTFFWKYCPSTILSIDLSNNSLTGGFPKEILFCAQIQALDLSHNEISGDVPVQKLSALENLTRLNLSYNNFSECKPSEVEFFDRFDSSNFIYSGILPDSNEFRVKAWVVLALVGIPFFVGAIVGFLGWIVQQRGFSNSNYRFKSSILKAATDGFSRRNLVGKTGSSCIYKGVMRDGREVRIEICSETATGSKFVEQMNILVQLNHGNIIPVLGWCDDRMLKAIVSEWIDGVNLETWLATTAPPWRHRVWVISGIASGISYLHKNWPQLGFSLKRRHILLSEDGEPLITQLRLSENDHHSSKKKIYQLGVLMLEMVTNRSSAERGFVEWVKMHCPGNLEDLIDKRMGKRMMGDVSEAVGILKLGVMCTDVSSRGQPSWDQIGCLLSGISSREIIPDSGRSSMYKFREHKYQLEYHPREV